MGAEKEEREKVALATKLLLSCFFFFFYDRLSDVKIFLVRNNFVSINYLNICSDDQN